MRFTFRSTRSVLIALAALCGCTGLEPVTAGLGRVDANGVEIAFESSGTGPTAVFLHGFGESHDAWQRNGIVAALHHRFRVVALDVRGHGESEKPYVADAYGRELAADVVRVLDALQVHRAHVVGYSLGALIALDVAVRYPDRVASVVLGGQGLASATDIERMRSEADALERMTDVPPHLDVTALAQLLRAVETPALEEVRALQIPVSVLIGANDRFMPSVDRLLDALPDTTVVPIPEADHRTAFMDPRFRDALVGGARFS